MIIELKKFKNKSSLFRIFFGVLKILLSFQRFFMLKSKALYYESSNILEGSYDFFPSLNKNREDESDIKFNCVSCSLCQLVCPTDALSINGDKDNKKIISKIDKESFNPKEGKAPKQFILNSELCNRCGMCKDVCLVNGINMKGHYKETISDLVLLS